jgi:hypothetical protein
MAIMRTSRRPRPIRGWSLLATVALFICFGAPVFASCAAPSPDEQCRKDFDTFTAVASVDNSFVAVGHLKTASPSQWTLAVLNGAGIISAQHDLVLKAPPDVNDDIASVEFTKAVALSKTSLALVGYLKFAGKSWFSSFALVVSTEGQIKWFRVSPDDNVNLMFQSAVFDSVRNRIIAVGRRTLGGDSGTCANWSQSYVQGFDAASGVRVEPQYARGATVKGPTDRQALYDIAPIKGGTQFAVVGFATVAGENGRCKDEILAGVLSAPKSAASAAWNSEYLDPFVDDNPSEEDGFAIASLGGSEALIAGYKIAGGTSHSVAHAVRIRFRPFEVESVFSGADVADPSRFRFLVSTGDRSYFLLGGSISGGASPKASVAQVVSDALKQSGSLPVATGAADLVAATVTQQGRVMVAGFGLDEAGQRVGWLNAVGAYSAAAPSAASPHIAIDKNAIDLETIAQIDGAYPVKATDKTLRYVKHRVDTSSEFKIAMTVTNPQALHIAGRAGKGEIDLALMDGDGHLIDFSNYRGDAPQLLVVNLAPGNYEIIVFAQKGTKDVEIEVGGGSAVNVAALHTLMSVLSSESLRERLADDLTKSGFSVPPEPSIALGGETALSVLAAEYGAHTPFGPKNIGGSLAAMFKN